MWTYNNRRDRTPTGVMAIAFVREAPGPHLTNLNSKYPIMGYDNNEELQDAYRGRMPIPTYHDKGIAVVAVGTTDASGDDSTKRKSCASVILLFLLASIIITGSIFVSVILTQKSCSAVQVKSEQSTTTLSLPSSSATYTTAQVTVTVASLTPGQDCYIPGTEQRLPDGNVVMIRTFYNGTVSVTLSGRECQMWASHTTHSHRGNGDAPDHFATGETMEEVANYCRIVLHDSEDIPWCYTTDPDKRWDNCNITKCT